MTKTTRKIDRRIIRLIDAHLVACGHDEALHKAARYHGKLLAFIDDEISRRDNMIVALRANLKGGAM